MMKGNQMTVFQPHNTSYTPQRYHGVTPTISNGNTELFVEVNAHPEFPITMRGFWNLKLNRKLIYVKHISGC
jgi:hypothetical protein